MGHADRPLPAYGPVAMPDTPPPSPPRKPRKSRVPVFWLAMIVLAALVIWLLYTLFASRGTPAPTQPAPVAHTLQLEACPPGVGHCATRMPALPA